MDPRTATPPTRGPLERPDTPAQWYALLAGSFLLAAGVLSLVFERVSFGTVGPLSAQPEFWIWTVSGWSTILWIAAGGIGLLAAARLDAARDFAVCAGIVFGIVAVWGFIGGNDVAGLIPADTTNNVTHAVIAGLGLLAAALPRRVQRPAEQDAETPAGAPSARSRPSWPAT
jgi:hypothetical protein